jgi:hypothetical protein
MIFDEQNPVCLLRRGLIKVTCVYGQMIKRLESENAKICPTNALTFLVIHLAAICTFS